MSTSAGGKSSPERMERFTFEDDGVIPNSPLPVLVYRGVISSDAATADGFEALFAQHGWSNAWRDSIFDYTHFHSTSHEVLAIVEGQVRVRLGGEHGASVDFRAGDVVVLPAGTGHRCETASEDLLVVGAYPDGRDFDIRRGDPAERGEVDANLAAVPIPKQDPIGGPDGALLAIWT